MTQTTTALDSTTQTLSRSRNSAGCLAGLLLLAGASQAWSDDFSLPLFVLAGVDHRIDTRDLGTHGLYLGFGYISGAPGLFQSGSAGVDLQLRHDTGGSITLDSYEVLYTERVFGIADQLYFGYGIGTGYDRLRVTTGTGQIASQHGWRITGKLMAGYSITKGVVIESAFTESGSIGGVNGSGFSAALGLWF